MWPDFFTERRLKTGDVLPSFSRAPSDSLSPAGDRPGAGSRYNITAPVFPECQPHCPYGLSNLAHRGGVLCLAYGCPGITAVPGESARCGHSYASRRFARISRARQGVLSVGRPPLTVSRVLSQPIGILMPLITNAELTRIQCATNKTNGARPALLFGADSSLGTGRPTRAGLPFALRPALSGKWRDVLAGEVGIEPTNAGIKIRCLDQLGDSPLVSLDPLFRSIELV